MNDIWTMNVDTYLQVMEEAIILGKERGKKEGEEMSQEFFEIAKKKGILDKIKYLGETEMDKDLLTGNLREKGFKILNPDEEERRKKNG